MQILNTLQTGVTRLGWGRILVGGMVVAMVTAAWLTLGLETRPVLAAPLDARLELSAGDVLVDTGKGAERTYTGAALRGGSTVEAAEGARALLRLSDGAALFLRGGTRLTLNGSAFQLEKGEVWLDTPPAERRQAVYLLGSVEVTASDAGLSLKRSGDEMTIYVARGLAAVTAKGGRVEVQAGEQATVKGEARPEIKPVAWWSDWTGGMADHAASSALAGAGAGTLYGVDLAAGPGTPAKPLEISRQVVRAVVRSGFSETEVDQTFFNAGDRPVEGWYWFAVPQGASVTGFALETDGVLVEGELIERKEAAAQYGRAVATGHEPALLEWIDARTYRARIFPVPNGGSRRVVVRYRELLPMVAGTLRYVYPMQSQHPAKIGEFSLTVDLGSAGRNMSLTTLAEARVEEGGRTVTMRRSGFTPRADFQLEGTPKKKPAPMSFARLEAGSDTADYLMLRYMPDLDWSSYSAQPGEVVVVVDTSAGGDDAARQLKAAAAEAIVRALSSSDRFALVSLDVRPTVLYPKEGLAPATEEELAKGLEALAEHPAGGATDLSAMLDVALGRLHGGVQPAIVYVGDGLATSGDTTAEPLIERVRRSLSTSRARLFTVGVGADANAGLLDALARAGGGQGWTMESAEQVTERALRLVAALKAPTITDLDVDVGAGLDEVFVTANGKVTRGDEVILLARSHHDLPPSIKVKGRIAGKAFERSYKVTRDRTGVQSLVPGLWAAEYIRRMLGSADDPEQVRGRVTSMGLEYGLMTPYTSFLALESEQAYVQQGIQRQHTSSRSAMLAAMDESDDRVSRNEGAAPAGQVMNRPVEVTEVARAKAVARRDVMEERQKGDVFAAMKEEKRAMEPEYEAAPAAVAPPAPAMADMPAQVARGGGVAATRSPAGARRNQAAENSVSLDAAATGAGQDLGAVTSQPALTKTRELVATGYGRLITVAPRACSDVSQRPLAERVVIWRQRLKTARQPQELVERLEVARASCELPDWRAEAQLLRLMERSITDEGTAALVLGHLSNTPDAQRYLGRLLLRRAQDDRLVAAVSRALFGSSVDWNLVDGKLQALADPEARLKLVRENLALSPDSPEGLLRLMKLLVETRKLDEALQVSRRLGERGLMTPQLARQTGDVLATEKQEDDAIRAYSEIVEFDSSNPYSRRLLGDLFLANGWYVPAYQQYKGLLDRNPRDSLTWLRLAAAAAGASRVDEALRIERSVAEAEGTPGPTDPRRYARLWSAARLARLLANPPQGSASPSGKELAESVTRKLKELQLFRGPGTLVILTWEDLGANLEVTANLTGVDTVLVERTDAGVVGLSAAMASAKGTQVYAKLKSAPLDRSLKLTRHELSYDGKAFQVQVKTVELPIRATSIALQ